MKCGERWRRDRNKIHYIAEAEYQANADDE
jgi:hypothetical protein